MISNKKHIQQLATVLLKRGIRNVIISPGSRNGPLIHTFVGSGHFHCRNIVDERSAAYFGIGLSQKLNEPVVLVCSSGTAALNYAPAVAEAYYLKVPLIVLTADRPPYWINQGESQCIVQNHIYRDFICEEVTIPLDETQEELQKAGAIIERTIDLTLGPDKGPVHINIPLEEPLHDLEEVELPSSQINISNTTELLPEQEVDKLATLFNGVQKVMVLVGQHKPDKELQNLLTLLSKQTQAIVLKEHLSNLDDISMIGNIDLCLSAINGSNAAAYSPDLLITFGGQMVSKSIKSFLRKHKPEEHWHISPSGDSPDTYKALTRVVKSEEIPFFQQILNRLIPKSNDFYSTWKELSGQVHCKKQEYLQEAQYSDLWVFNELTQKLPSESILHLGNSMPVRYTLLCDQVEGVRYMGNRGTSGIDGSVSTGVGYACGSENINTIVVGDLSFLYDSNALWNNYLGSNLRIVVVNNGGGNIFGIIKGPSKSPAYLEHFFAEHKHTAEGLAKNFGLEYNSAKSEKEFQTRLTEFFEPQNKPVLLEVFTEEAANNRVFHELFNRIKQA